MTAVSTRLKVTEPRPAGARDITVVGGNVAGMAFVGHYLQRAGREPRISARGDTITVLQPGGVVGANGPFAPDVDEAILNQLPESLSWDPGKPGDYARSLDPDGILRETAARRAELAVRHRATYRAVKQFYRENPIEEHRPRREFGEYLNLWFAEFVKFGRARDITVQVLSQSATDMRREEGTRVAVRGNGKQWNACDGAVICVGNPGPPARLWSLSGPGYINNPRPYGVKIPIVAKRLMERTNKFIIAGTGPTAFDFYRTWRRLEISDYWRSLEFDRRESARVREFGLRKDPGYIATVVMASPSGTLPAVRMRPTKDVELKHFTAENLAAIRDAFKGVIPLDAVIELAEREFVAHKLSRELLCRELRITETAHQRLRRHLKAYDGHDDNTRRALMLLGKMSIHDQFLWRFGGAAVGEGLFGEYDSSLNALRAPMPVDDARSAERLMRREQLVVLPGLQDGVNGPNGEILVNFDGRGRPDFQIAAPVLVNGATLSALNPDDPFVDNLVRRKFLAAHPLGGFDVDYETQQAIPPNGSRRSNVAVIGQMTRGVHRDQSSVLRVSEAAYRGANWMFDTLHPSDTRP